MKKIITLLMTLLLLIVSHANNVIISNISLVNNGPNNIYVQFNLSWENSWRVAAGQANYDGVWVFFKYKTATDDWTHLFLNTSTAADLLPASLDYWRPTAAGATTGCVIYRSATNMGTGNITATGIRLTVSNSVEYNIELRGYAIEMVYIPPPLTGIRFGDGDGTNESTNAFHPAGSDNNYTSNDVLSSVDPNLNDDSHIETPNDFMIIGGNADGLSNLPISNSLFPTCSAIWCMKYEMTQGAYRDFLNTLTVIQQTTRTVNPPTSPTGTAAISTGISRQVIEIKTPSAGGVPAVYGCDASGNNIFDEANDGEFLSMNFLAWRDVAAWLDWAGMSPMTEIHFERICRGTTSAGPIAPQFGEFPWGSTSIHSAAYTFPVSPNTASETISNASTTAGNALYTTTFPSISRNGVFATTTSNRVTSGSAFYGVMDMSGSVMEMCVSVGNIAGRSFNKLGNSRGNGSLSVNGNADVPHWPGNVNAENLETVAVGEVFAFVAGIKMRGGAFNSLVDVLRISDRSLPVNQAGSRDHSQGGRGVIVIAMY